MNFSLSKYWSRNRDVISTSRLKKAMHDNQLELYFLPVISMQEEKTIELEALLRWHVADDEYIPPMTFIPFAEKNGLMPDLTRCVIKQLIHLIKSWQDSGIEINWSMNLSPNDLQDTTLVADLKTELMRNDIKENVLGVEICHSTVNQASKQDLDFLLKMRSEGIRLILDGYDLKKTVDELVLPDAWDSIKIDRKLVMELRTHPEYINEIKKFMQQVNMRHIICVPGINSFYEWEKIKLLNCNQAQGFYLSPPQSADDVKLWLQVSKWGNHTDSHIDSDVPKGEVA